MTTTTGIRKAELIAKMNDCVLNTDASGSPDGRLVDTWNALVGALSTPTNDVNAEAISILSLTKEQARRAWHRKIGCTTWESCPTEKECRAFDAGFDAASAVSPQPTTENPCSPKSS